MPTDDEETILCEAEDQTELLHMIHRDLEPGDQLVICRGDNKKCKPPFDCDMCARFEYVKGMSVADMMGIVRNCGHA
jgi:hypothetical protein